MWEALKPEPAVYNKTKGARKGYDMDFKNLAAVIDFAIQKEKEASAFYTELSTQAVMSGVKEMLLEYAEEEKKHQKLLENIVTAETDAGLEGYEFKWIRDLKRSDYLTDLEYTPDMGYRDILVLAMKREEVALKLYQTLLENAQKEGYQKVFKMLCQEEAKHKLALETLYDDYMAEMGD